MGFSSRFAHSIRHMDNVSICSDSRFVLKNVSSAPTVLSRNEYELGEWNPSGLFASDSVYSTITGSGIMESGFLFYSSVATVGRCVSVDEGTNEELLMLDLRRTDEFVLLKIDAS